MKLNQYYKLIILFFNIVVIFGESYEPIDVEENITLVINNKKLTYNKLDDNGLKYVHLGSEKKIGDSIRVAIYSRVVMPPDYKKNKKFGFSIHLNDDLPFELT